MLAWFSAWGADLHIAQQMPLPLPISCSSKSRLVLTFLVLPFWYLLTRVDPDIFQTSSKTVVCCVCVLWVYASSLRPVCCFWVRFLCMCFCILWIRLSTAVLSCSSLQWSFICQLGLPTVVFSPGLLEICMMCLVHRFIWNCSGI